LRRTNVSVALGELDADRDDTLAKVDRLADRLVGDGCSGGTVHHRRRHVEGRDHRVER
jgi:hypothetical protein